MSYLDRRDLLSADLMTRSISKEGSIKYYNSDKNVANIYMKLMAESPDGAQKEVSVDEASNYTVTIDAIKSKTNQIRTVPGVLSNDLTDETCAIWKFELGEDLTNQIGEVICQTYVKNTTQNLTMRYFAYTVEADKLTGLNSEIVTDPDLPILKELIKEVQETAQTVNNIDNVNVSDTKTYSNKKIEEKFSGVDAQFNTVVNEKLDKNGIVTMANMGQDIREALTGGSVAVIDRNMVLNETVVNGEITPIKTNFLKIGNNLLDENMLYPGYLYNNGTLKTGNYRTTMYIPFSNGSILNLSRMDTPTLNKNMSRRAIRTACFYDANYNLLTDHYYDNSSNISESVTYTGAGTVAYIRASISLGFLDGKSMLYLGAERTQFESAEYNIDKLKLNETMKNQINEIMGDNIKNKKMIIFGDSIARGQGNNNIGFGEIIANKNNMTLVNYAVGGATIRVKPDNTNNILNQIINCNETGDYILFDGYINDCYPDVLDNLGAYTDNYGSTFDTSKFTGAFDEICKQLQLKFNGKKILFICVHKMNTRDTLIVKQINELARKILSKWNIPVVDLYNEGMLNTYLNDYKKYTNNSDGTHPNQLGYDLFYINQIEQKLKTL